MNPADARIGQTVLCKPQSSDSGWRGRIVRIGYPGDGFHAESVLVEWLSESRGRRMPTWCRPAWLTEIR